MLRVTRLWLIFLSSVRRLNSSLPFNGEDSTWLSPFIVYLPLHEFYVRFKFIVYRGRSIIAIDFTQRWMRVPQKSTATVELELAAFPEFKMVSPVVLSELFSASSVDTLLVRWWQI